MFTDIIIHSYSNDFELTLEVHNSFPDLSLILTICLFHKCFWRNIMNIALYQAMEGKKNNWCNADIHKVSITQGR